MKNLVMDHFVSEDQKNQIMEKITELLKEKNEVIFAYVYGSFLSGGFRDIDIGIYPKEENLNFELDLETELEQTLGFPVDVRNLNSAPPSFRFNVIKGFLLVSKDEKTRTDFESLTISLYHDFKFYRDRYRREVLGI